MDRSWQGEDRQEGRERGGEANIIRMSGSGHWEYGRISKKGHRKRSRFGKRHEAS